MAEVQLLNKEVLLVSLPRGLPRESNFEVTETKLITMLPPPAKVVLKLLWISIDPYLRKLMQESKSPVLGLSALKIGKVMTTYGLFKVIASDSPQVEKGSIIYGNANMATYSILPADAALKFRKVSSSLQGIPLTHYLGVLGFPGFTAWVGVNVITQLQPKDKVFISAAAGAVGLVVGQLAKLKGCHVVGSVGTCKKVNVLKEVYHFDDAFNYKREENFELALRRYFPDGFDVCFDNVGGEMLDAALEVINPNGRIISSGMISQYNKEPGEVCGFKNLFNIVGKSLKMEGFIQSELRHYWEAFEEEVTPLLQEGTLKYKTDVLGRGIEAFGKAFFAMLTGENIGKSVLYVCDE